MSECVRLCEAIYHDISTNIRGEPSDAVCARDHIHLGQVVNKYSSTHSCYKTSCVDRCGCCGKIAPGAIHYQVNSFILYESNLGGRDTHRDLNA